jgi:hypothetical protein
MAVAGRERTMETCGGGSGAGQIDSDRDDSKETRGQFQSALRLRNRDMHMPGHGLAMSALVVMLRREGWLVGRKRVLRLYLAGGPAIAHA